MGEQHKNNQKKLIKDV